MTTAFVNKKAWFNYEMIETFESGIVLLGNEVKSIRNGKLNISEAFIRIKDGEATIHNMEIQSYEKTALFTLCSFSSRR